ncbi:MULTISPECIES: hypothetical protein [unclassified Sulfitobacter]|uniref:hypothetical protein n=1 Tax=unclassified Sulfitobacter TaxID=196795 RepID=UPI003746109A
MLTFVMATENEGPDLDLTLDALVQAKGPEDALLVFHAGDDRTFARLQTFAAGHSAQIIRTDSPVGNRGDLLRLALEMAETDYTMALAPTDRLQPEAFRTLRRTLQQETPDLCLLHSAWWLADADHPLPRSDSALLEALPQRPSVSDCAGLLPDPRRLIFRTPDWLARLATWPPSADDRAFYERALTQSTELMAAPAPVLLHLYAPTNPAPALLSFTEDLTVRPKSERVACLVEWMPFLDEQLALCPPAETSLILNALPNIVAHLPRPVRRNMSQQPGAFACLLDAQIKDGSSGAKAELSLQISAQQQYRTDILARAYGRLRQDLDLALPGPDYLRNLYTRLRGL